MADLSTGWALGLACTQIPVLMEACLEIRQGSLHLAPAPQHCSLVFCLPPGLHLGPQASLQTAWFPPLLVMCLLRHSRGVGQGPRPLGDLGQSRW